MQVRMVTVQVADRPYGLYITEYFEKYRGTIIEQQMAEFVINNCDGIITGAGNYWFHTEKDRLLFVLKYAGE